jgi:hypothetical protein
MNRNAVDDAHTRRISNDLSISMKCEKVMIELSKKYAERESNDKADGLLINSTSLDESINSMFVDRSYSFRINNVMLCSNDLTECVAYLSNNVFICRDRLLNNNTFPLSFHSTRVQHRYVRALIVHCYCSLNISIC